MFAQFPKVYGSGKYSNSKDGEHSLFITHIVDKTLVFIYNTTVAETKEAILNLTDIHKIYKTSSENTVALKNLNLRIKKGESIAIIGKSGSGKSTLMHVMATLDRPSSGELSINGVSTTELKNSALDDLRNKTFGFVFQQFFVNPRNSCLDNVILPLVIAGVKAKERRARGLEILESVGLIDKAKAKANDLSGGQKQRLCIARALITQPEVIFADEPTGNLDSETGKIIIDLLFDLHRKHNLTLVVVTHDQELADLCDRQIILKDGVIIQES
ncbi:MAG: ABC transporter ATP-binding protein [bacterium]|nr:ABC transporter ATP-binding protein [bacterium]